MELRAHRPSSLAAANLFAMVRPENIHLDAARPDHLPSGTTILNGSIDEVLDFGSVVTVRVVRCPSEGRAEHGVQNGPVTELLVSLGKKEYHGRHLGIGDRVHLVIASEDVHVMEE